MKRLSDLIEAHINDTGTGFEMDDIISIGRYPDEVVQAILAIEKQNRSSRYKFGLSNPASFPALRALAARYPAM